MKISVIQSREKFHYDPKNPGEFDLDHCRRLSAAGLEEDFAMIETALRGGAQLVVTIEALNATVRLDDPRYRPAEVFDTPDCPLVERFVELAHRHRAWIVAGLLNRRNGHAYNSAFLFGPHGAIAGIYDKVHLPCGEAGFLTPGSSFPIFPTEHGTIGMLICWDMQYPEAPRELALAGADLIACPTWGWENRYGLCRAYENSVTVAAAMGVPCEAPLWDFCDPSVIVDNMGHVLAAAGRTGPQIVTADVDIRREPALQYGAECYTDKKTMRHVRASQRRPDAYRLVGVPTPPLLARYDRQA